ncbi:DUF705 domain-containing protein [Candidatus Woesearchaeota archaeon]|nr:DUF705 domain-containing protein [Candidatus Woesearchaeota archaeon]MBW3013905.1 DUF705 domain-containing protein [Candidatus Woesearchaeota archaeon]
MAKNIIFDLEQTLIWGVNPMFRLKHPEAEEVLGRARRDFNTVTLWSFAFMKEVLDAVRELKWAKYFDGVIACEVISEEEQASLGLKERVNTTLCYFKDGQETGRTRFPLDSGTKELSMQGDPSEYVLIENMPTYGRPKDRVIETIPFQGQKCDLIGPYEKALKMFG